MSVAVQKSIPLTKPEEIVIILPYADLNAIVKAPFFAQNDKNK